MSFECTHYSTIHQMFRNSIDYLEEDNNPILIR